MQRHASQVEIINISDSSDESSDEDIEVHRLAQDLTFSPSGYSDEVALGDGVGIGRPVTFGHGSSAKDGLAQKRRTCLDRIVDVFPDISLEHVTQLYENHLATGPLENDQSAALISKILDSGPYPKEKDIKDELKRKREENSNADEDEREVAAWAAMHRPEDTGVYYSYARRFLGDDFLSTTYGFIDRTLRTTGKNLFAAYGIVDHAERTLINNPNPPYNKLKKPRTPVDGIDRSSPTWLQVLTSQHVKISSNGIEEELQAARKKRMKKNLKHSEEADLAAANAANEQEHRETGMMVECQCCFDDIPFNKMTHCDGEKAHFFCLECAKRNASNEIGQSRHKLFCMDSSGCKAEFPRAQMVRFLEDSTLKALDRIKQREELRSAKLEGLTQCPFCDFAAICPPVDVDREFRCRNQECEKVSCRLCNQETHIPLSCEGHAKENKSLARHAVEEAMTEALLRSCNKCKESYVKEDGCNKMACRKCKSLQCYVCSKTIEPREGYSHFNDTTRGGQTGRCPLFDNTAQRQQEEVQKAEKAALAKVKADNPNLSEEDLKIKFSDAVGAGDEARLRPLGGPQHDPALALLMRRQPYLPGPRNLIGDLAPVGEPPYYDFWPLEDGPNLFDPNNNLGHELHLPPHLFPRFDVDQPRLRRAFHNRAGQPIRGALPIQAQHQAPMQALAAQPQAEVPAVVPQHRPKARPRYHDRLQPFAGRQPLGGLQARVRANLNAPSPLMQQQNQAQHHIPGRLDVVNPYPQHRDAVHEAPAVEQAPRLRMEQDGAPWWPQAAQQHIAQPDPPIDRDHALDEDWWY